MEGAKAVATPVCEMLGIEQPIVQAPMSDIPRLAAAVSNAGALGMVTLTWSADVGASVRATAALTARPFGGNLVLTEDRHGRLDQAPAQPALGSRQAGIGQQHVRSRHLAPVFHVANDTSAKPEYSVPPRVGGGQL